MSYEQMMYMRELPNCAYVQEVIEERFDNALSLLSKHAVVFGGAIRDALAGTELLGDLDISIPKLSHGKVSKSFLTNPRWTRTERSPKHGSATGKSSISIFKNANDREVQLITANKNILNPLKNALHLIYNVDIICCAVGMFMDGRVFEFIPGAYEDCRDRKLNFNKFANSGNPDALPGRVKKLLSRGWVNQIDVESAIREMKTRIEKENKIRSKGKTPRFSGATGFSFRLEAIDHDTLKRVAISLQDLNFPVTTRMVSQRDLIVTCLDARHVYYLKDKYISSEQGKRFDGLIKFH
jgi:hypothetical protein